MHSRALSLAISGTLVLLALSLSAHATSNPTVEAEPWAGSIAKLVPVLPVCDGTVDDTANMQAWLTYASATRETFVVPATLGGCKITAPLTVASNTHIVQHGRVFAGSGYAKPSPSTSQWGMYTVTDGATGVVIEGAGTLDGNNQAQAAGIVTGGPEVGDPLANIKDVAVLGLTIKKMPALWAVRIDGTAGIRLDGLNVSESATGVEVGHGTTRAVATNLRIDDIDGNCFSFLDGAIDSSVSSSIFSNCGGVGVAVLTTTSTEAVNRNLLVDNNIVYSSQKGIQTLSQGTSPSSNGINVTANQVHHNREYGIGVLACDSCQVSANLSHQNGSAPYAYQPGLFVSNSRGVKLSSNTVRNEGQGTTTGTGIVLQDTLVGRAASQNVVVTGNFVYDDQPTKTMTSAIAGNLTSAKIITGNSIGPGIGGVWAGLCTSPSICTNNQVLP